MEVSSGCPATRYAELVAWDIFGGHGGEHGQGCSTQGLRGIATRWIEKPLAAHSAGGHSEGAPRGLGNGAVPMCSARGDDMMAV